MSSKSPAATAPAESETETPVRPSNRRRRKLIAGLAATAVISTATFGAAQAGGLLFSDVPYEHPFAEDIYWLAQAGISTGYDDGTFRPEDPVTRQAMAAFLHRYHDLDDTIIATPEAGGPYTTTSEGWVQLPGAQAEFTLAPGMDGTLLATFSAETACSGVDGFCRARVMVDDPATGAPGPTELRPEASGFAFDSTDSGTETTNSWESHSMQKVVSLGGLEDEGIPGSTWVAWVEVSTTDGQSFRLDDWVLSVQVDVQDTQPILILE